MSEADKMFEELGYEKWIDSRNVTHLRVIGKVLNIPLGRDIIIEYSPMCRKEARRVKTEQEINKEIQKHKEAIQNKIGEKTQDDKIHLWIIQTLEWVLK